LPVRKEKKVSRGFRVGQWIRVRSSKEILDTLDADGTLDGLPFMPEMLKYCGQRYRVYRSAHKTCDTVLSWAIRSVDDAVHLDLRCDGSAHGGCQAGCLFFWKTAWLKSVDGDNDTQIAVNATTDASDAHIASVALTKGTRQPSSTGETEPRYRCQATQLRKFTREVTRRGRWNPIFYLRDLTSGNVRPLQFLWFGAIAVLNAFSHRWLRRRYPHLCGGASGKTPMFSTNLSPGEIVQVRSKDEIMQTVNADMRNRGLSFDVEMVAYCGTEQRVLRRVEQIIDEKTGRMMRLPNPCIVLDGIVCSGNLSMTRMFCPRSIYPYWREIWLKRLTTD